MNSLSWLIYAADALSGVGVLFGLGGAASLFGAAITFLAGNATWCRWPWDTEPDWSRKMAFQASLRRAPKRLALFGMIALTICAIIPSPRTMYLIAASQLSEQVATSPDTIEIIGDLKAIIKQKLKDELAPKPRS